jgi:hypothetical protein
VEQQAGGNGEQKGLWDVDSLEDGMTYVRGRARAWLLRWLLAKVRPPSLTHPSEMWSPIALHVPSRRPDDPQLIGICSLKKAGCSVTDGHMFPEGGRMFPNRWTYVP